jgi:hypothetical protein
MVWIATEEAGLCFAHSGTPSDALHVQAGVGTDAATAFTIRYMSTTMSVSGWAQQMSTWPSAGGSSGCGE